MNKKTKVEITSRDMRPSSVDALVCHLNSIDWAEHTNGPNYDKNVSRIHQVLTVAIDEYTPETTCLVNYKNLRREPWLTTSLQISTKKAKQLYKQTQKRDCNNHCYEKYKKYNQILIKIRRNAKRCHYMKMCDKFKNNSIKLWQTIKKVSGK